MKPENGQTWLECVGFLMLRDCCPRSSRVSERRRDRPGVFILPERLGDSPRPLVRRMPGEVEGADAGCTAPKPPVL